MTADPLDQFITHLAIHLAHATGVARDQAEVFIADLVDRARA